MTAEQTPFIDAVQAGDILGVHANTIYEMIDEGLLAAAKVGKSWRLRRQDVDNYLSNQIEEQTRQRKERKQNAERPGTLPVVMARRRPRKADSFALPKFG
ncbi:MAG TPA: helix-turn-helix domain-containing protein [Rhodocyclaceae bacterium]|nr:helix-turn-helix domain-containing protein [Rhodocyclaceae bacterium]